jgi:arginine N-succinyltransferase
VFQMAHFAQVGMTNLPKDPELLGDKIHHACESFASPTLESATYLFVMEHIPTQTLLGISGIVSRVGVTHPLHYFRLESYTPSGVKETYNVLHLDAMAVGPTEVCTLYLRKDARGKGIGRFMSLHRFLFMGPHLSLFQPTVLAEMRGMSDRHGFSPFYAYIWENRFLTSFQEADAFCVKYPHKIPELAPRYPIEVSLLSDWAQEVVGQPHQQTVPAFKLLEGEGFRFNQKVCLLDGGPILEAKTRDIRVISSMNTTRTLKAVSEKDFLDLPGSWVMVSTGTVSDYRAVLGHAHQGQIFVTDASFNALKATQPNEFVYSPLYYEVSS